VSEVKVEIKMVDDSCYVDGCELRIMNSELRLFLALSFFLFARIIKEAYFELIEKRSSPYSYIDYLFQPA